MAGRRLTDGTMLYGCTCNLSVDFSACDQDFDVSFTGVRGPALRRCEAVTTFRLSSVSSVLRMKSASVCSRAARLSTTSCG